MFKNTWTKNLSIQMSVNDTLTDLLAYAIEINDETQPNDEGFCFSKYFV